jgi:hypothetical protein
MRTRLSWFPDDDACLDYLDWLRWPQGFCCPRCGHGEGWRLADGRYWCEPCRRRVSIPAGTVFHRTRTPLTVWFAAAWFMTSSKNGVSAKTLHRLLAFRLLPDRLCDAAPVPDRDDPARPRASDRVRRGRETYIGGTKPGKRGRGAAGKVLVAVAVEQLQPKGLGRCRLRVMSNPGGADAQGVPRRCVEPGAVLVTDGFPSYPPAIGDTFVHEPHVVKGSGVQALPVARHYRYHLPSTRPAGTGRPAPSA